MRLARELQEEASKIIKSATNPPLLIIYIFYIVEKRFLKKELS